MMADFFAKLAGRALGVDPSPRPVIAPLFAPGPATAGEYAPGVIQEQVATGEGSPFPATPPAMQEELQPMAQPATREGIQASREYRVQSDTGGNQPPPETDRPRIEGRPARVQQPEHESIMPRIALEPSFSHSTPVRPEVSIHQERPALHPENPPTDPLWMPAPLPAVRVSIGRIDVRAVMAPAPAQPKRASQPAPGLSLDEYLQARNRGQR